MMNDLMPSFCTDTVGIAIMGSFFFYAYASMQIPVGMIIDRYGTHIPAIIALSLCSVGVVLFSQSTSLWEAIAARTVIGATSAFAFVTTLTLIKEHLSPKFLTTAIGILQCLGAIGSLMGQEPIRVLAQHIGWQATLYTIATMLLILAVCFMCSRYQKEPNSKVLNHSHVSSLKLRTILTNVRCWIIITIGALSWMPVGAFGSLWGIPFMVAHFKITSIESSEMMRLFWLGLASSPLIGLINDTIKHSYWLILALFSVALLSMISLILTKSYLINDIALYGLGLSCSIQSLSLVLVRREFPSQIFARLASIVNMSAIIGAGLAQYITIKIMNYNYPGYHTNTNEYTFHSYQLGLSFLPICALAGCLLIIFSRRLT
tara:strand:+ start:5619 stop:6743 length:1125 start_codon:yes stop_codon:yes gene_type:complete